MKTRLIQILIPAAIVAALAIVPTGALAGGGNSNHGGGGGGKNFTCTNQGGGPHHSVYCIGTINGNSVTVNVLNLSGPLTVTQLNILSNDLNNTGINILGLAVLDQVNILSGNAANVLSQNGISVCQVKVIEAGVVNNNYAACS